MDFYVVLGVPRAATVIDVKRAYRKLARRFHPDINPGDHVAALRFKEITEAYETLSDPERRRRYDVLGYQPEPASASTGFEGFDFSASVHTVQQGTFGDLFAEVFTREHHATWHATRRRPARHADAEVRPGAPRGRATAHDHAAGSVRDCAGAGTLRGPGAVYAVSRHGQLRAARGHMVFPRASPRCQGAGVQRVESMPDCGGIGLQTRAEMVTIRVPAGAPDGARLRVAGPGHVGPWRPAGRSLRGGAGGARTRCSGGKGTICTWCCRWPCTKRRSARGSRLQTPDGRARVRVPPGTHRAAVPAARPRRPIAAERPPRRPRRRDSADAADVLDERSKELLREFGAINGESVRRCARAGSDPDGRHLAGQPGESMVTKRRGKAYYMISAVAQKYNIHPQTLRLYEREGLLKPSRTEGNTRLYSEEDLEQLETILSLTRDLGVNLAGVEIILNMRRKIERCSTRSTSSWPT